MRRQLALTTGLILVTAPPVLSAPAAAQPSVEIVATAPRSLVPLPESLATALDKAATLTARSAADLGYAWADRTTGRLVIDAVTPRGVATATAFLARAEVAGRVRTVPRSRAHLERVKHDAIRLTSDVVPDGELVHQTEPDAEHNRVIVTVERPSDRLLRGLAERYGRETVAVRVDPVVATQLSGGRGQDVNPFWGGAYISSGSGSTLCTSGFAWKASSTTWGMLTAGHCAPNGGAVDTSQEHLGLVTDPNENWNLVTGTETGVGDLALVIVNSSKKSGAVMYRGTASGVHGYPVREMWHRRAQSGDKYCTGGRTTGELCNWEVDRTGIDYRYNNADGNRPTIQDAVRGLKYGTCSKGGDSGGPAFTVRADNGIAAKGITSGGSGGGSDEYGGVADPCYHYFSDVHDVAGSVGGSGLLLTGNSPGSTLANGRTLWPHDYLLSTDGRFIVRMQPDGNFVLYKPGNVPVWSSGTPSSGNAGTKAYMQPDGNLVLYRPNSTTDPGLTAIWASGTAGRNGAYLVMQNDCNLVIYQPTATGQQAVWASHTYLCA